MPLPRVNIGGLAVDRRDDEIRRLSSQVRSISKERDDLTKALQKEIDELRLENNKLRTLGSKPAKQEQPIREETFDRKRTCFVELGRYGDIINILPIVRDKFIETGIKPVVAVSRGFEDLFDCVTYADALPLPLKTTEILPAIDEAKARFEKVIVTQIYGIKYDPGKQTKHFNIESWRIGGYLDRWDDPSLRLVFDKRSYSRERLLIDKLIPSCDKPVIFVNLISYSSPFSQKSSFKERLFKRWSDQVSLIDVSDYKAHNIVDLLGLMEIADAVLTVDTATIHLALAVDTPVMGVFPVKCWRKPKLKCNVILDVDASVPNPDFGPLDEAIAELIRKTKSRNVVHAVEWHENSDPRVSRAQSTWDKTGWTVKQYREYSRDARSLGDPRALPFMRDVLTNALSGASHHDYIVMTNDDNGLSENADREIRSVLSRAVMATGRRFDPEEPTHIGRDLIAFRAGWLKHNFDLIPDFILGAPEWDLWAAAFARKLCGADWSEKTSHVHCGVCEITSGVVTHERHVSHWSKNQGDQSARYNVKLRRSSI